MALTAAEKQRRYRERRDADPERRERYLLKEKSAWANRKALGKWKSMSDLPDREKRYRKMKNRCAQRRFRECQQCLTANTPPATSSDPSQQESRPIHTKRVYVRRRT